MKRSQGKWHKHGHETIRQKGNLVLCRGRNLCLESNLQCISLETLSFRIEHVLLCLCFIEFRGRKTRLVFSIFRYWLSNSVKFRSAIRKQLIFSFSLSSCWGKALASHLAMTVDQPVHWCLDTLHRHRLRCKDRPYGEKLSKDIDRISSLFY